MKNKKSKMQDLQHLTLLMWVKTTRLFCTWPQTDLFNLGRCSPLICFFTGTLVCKVAHFCPCKVCCHCCWSVQRQSVWEKPLFLLISIQSQSQAPPTQALVTSGALRADVTDPRCLLITCVFIQIFCQCAHTGLFQSRYLWLIDAF